MLLGIDFGTSKSVVAAYLNGAPAVIPDEKGHRFMPSIVSVLPDQSLRIGWDAVNLPPLTRRSPDCYNIDGVKRALGHQGETSWGAFKAYPQEIAALILSRLKTQAEIRLEAEVSEVVWGMRGNLL
jgi:molecular chaperone DnaK (HSP70)